jgi:HD-GYP domain-containing protein (c-di-GMP phosphodiesterase class II)
MTPATMDASAPRINLRQLPLGFRLLTVMLGAAAVVSVLVTVEVGDRGIREREAARHHEVQRAAHALAERAAQHLAADDDLRLALVAAAAKDALGGGGRLAITDARGRTRFDSSTLDGPSVAAGDLPTANTAAVVACVHDGRRVGEVRVNLEVPIEAAAFAWGLFGLVFLTSLSLVCLAVAACHHWLARVREVTDIVRKLAKGEMKEPVRTDAPGVVGELQMAVADVAHSMQAGVDGVRESVIELGLALVDQVERRDQTPAGHCERTAKYSAMLADRLSLRDEEKREIELAARLHDIGKVAIRPALLDKKGPLTEEERATLRQHPDRGASFFASVPRLREVALIIRHHHEKYDGSGYPDGLRGERIPLGARIIALTDAYDVLTSRGFEGTPLSWAQAFEHMRTDRGEHFDPWLFDVFHDAIRSAPTPDQPVRMVVISPQGVVPYKAAEPSAMEPTTSN